MESEKTLDELLGEPIIRLLMRRDGVEAQEVRTLMDILRRRIAASHDHPLRRIPDVAVPAVDVWTLPSRRRDCRRALAERESARYGNPEAGEVVDQAVRPGFALESVDR